MAVNLISTSLPGGNSSGDSDLRRRLALAMALKAMNGDPVQSPWQGANKMAQALIAGMEMGAARDRESNGISGMGDFVFGAGTSPKPGNTGPFAKIANLFGGRDSPAAPDGGVPSASPASPTVAKPKGFALDPAATDPTPLFKQEPDLTTGGKMPTGIDRSRFSGEISDPNTVARLAGMVKGEVGLGRDPNLETIQTESALNRAQARNIPLAQALMSVGDDPKRGYYARDTYSRPPTEQQVQYFKDNILPKVMAGSDLGTEFLGSPVTGNASQLAFAGRRAAQGMYDNSKWYSGVPGRGEMFVTEKGDAARAAKNMPSGMIVPPELMAREPMMTPQDPNGNPIRVASADAGFVPQPQSMPQSSAQPMQVAQGFEPAQFPNVQNLNVRPVGAQPAPMPPQAPQPMPQGQAPQAPVQTAQAPQGQTPQPKANELLQHQFNQAASEFKKAMSRGDYTTAKAIAAYGQQIKLKMLEPQKYEYKTDGDGNVIAIDPTNPANARVVQPQGVKPKYTFHQLPDGTIVRQDPRTGTAEPVYQGQQKPSFTDVGIDPQTGQPIKGFVDPSKREVSPYRVPGQENQNSSIPPAPPGVDPKIWREKFSESRANEAVPATPKQATELRKEIADLPSYKNVAQSAPVYKSMLSAAGRDTRGSDVNLIYGMAKIMDPASVVRESEMNVAQAIATLPQYLQANITSQIKATGRLDKDVRAAIMEEAYSRMESYQYMYDQDAQMYRGIAQRSKISEDDAIPKFGPFDPYKPPSPQAAPQPGQPQAAPQQGGQAGPSIDDLLKKYGPK